MVVSNCDNQVNVLLHNYIVSNKYRVMCMYTLLSNMPSAEAAEVHVDPFQVAPACPKYLIL